MRCDVLWTWAKRVLVGVVAIALTAFFASAFAAIQDRNEQRTQIRALLYKTDRVLSRLDDCTTPSPVPPPASGPDTRRPEDIHECAERGTQATAEAIAQLRFSIDCANLYAKGSESEPCAEVFDRLRRLEAGENPFATPGGSR